MHTFHLLVVDFQSLNLKNAKRQPQALLVHRLIRLSIYRKNISYDASLLALRQIDESPPIDIRSISGPMEIFAHIFIDFAYTVIQKIPMEDFVVKDF